MSTPARSFLHVIQRYYPFVGGSEDYFGVLSAYFAAHGDRVTVYTTDAWDLEHFWAAGKRRSDWGGEAREHAGVRVERFAVRRPPLWRLGYPVTRRLMTHLSDLPAPGGEVVLRAAGHLSPWVPGLERRLRETNERFDLVHTANIALEGVILAAAAYCRRRDVPFVVTPFVHLGEDGDRRVRKYYSMRHQLALLRQADAVIAQTARERRFLLDHGVPAERLHLAGAGVDPAAVTGGDGAAFRARHDIAGPIVAIIGTTAYDKGTPHVVEAMRRFWRDGGEATLVIAGPTMDHFLRYFAALPAADRARCRLLGFISAEEKRDLLAATDVFALPSRTDSFGIVYLESWCNGAPVIGARAGGVPDVID
ncbi:MAG: glycosyltransferase family 4 protein, partial [Thermomicrobiales bacterium]